MVCASLASSPVVSCEIPKRNSRKLRVSSRLAVPNTRVGRARPPNERGPIAGRDRALVPRPRDYRSTRQTQSSVKAVPKLSAYSRRAGTRALPSRARFSPFRASSEAFFASIKGGWVDLKDMRSLINRPGVRQNFPDVLVLDFLEADSTSETKFGGVLSDIS